jgi:hypothetical protein
MGHTNAMLTIAVKLKELGHDVSFGVPTIEIESPIDIGKMPNIIKTSLSIPEKIKANGINFVIVKIPKKIALKAMLLPLTKGFIETEFAKDI